MPTPTYDLIEEKVLGSAQASVTFSSIPGTYKDLVLEVIGTGVTSDELAVRFNSDTGTNYSCTYLIGYGSGSGTSGRTTSAAQARIGSLYNVITNVTSQIMSYANTNVNKTAVNRSNQAGNAVEANVCLWRSTAAITSITILLTGAANIASGTTARLWGVSG